MWWLFKFSSLKLVLVIFCDSSHAVTALKTKHYVWQLKALNKKNSIHHGAFLILKDNIIYQQAYNIPKPLAYSLVTWQYDFHLRDG